MESNVKDAIKKTVSDFIKNKKIFIALNITRELQKQNLPVRHEDIKDEIHFSSLYQGNETEYNRKLVSIPGFEKSVWIYFSNHIDIFNVKNLEKLKYGPVDDHPNYMYEEDEEDDEDYDYDDDDDYDDYDDDDYDDDEDEEDEEETLTIKGDTMVWKNNLIEKVVDSFLQSGKIFTALNVSRELQRNHNVDKRHITLKRNIHAYCESCMASSFYTRDLISIPGIQDSVYAYFPSSIDINNYDVESLKNGPIDTKDNSVATTNVVTASTVAAPAQVILSATPKMSISLDKRSRLWIPSSLIKEIGAAKQSSLFIKADVAFIRISKSQIQNTDAVYTVDRKSNIAISKHVLEKALLTNKTTFNVYVESNDIIVD